MKIKIGQYNIGSISDNFQKHFGNMDFKIPKKLELKHKILDRYMTTKEILKEWHPQKVTLGEFVWALDNPKKMLKNSYPNILYISNIFYIRDSDNILHAVIAGWHSDSNDWGIDAYPVTTQDRWYKTYQVIALKFSI